MEEIFKLVDLSVGYGTKTILSNLNFSIYKQDLLGIVGPNGSGKTTLLNTLLGIRKPLKGKLIKNAARVGYVPQRDIINPILPYTVHDVVMMGRYPLLPVFSSPGKEDESAVSESLEILSIQHLSQERYSTLSGGQRQRTLMARALALRPEVLILDEPTNGMDTPSHYSLLSLIAELHKRMNISIIIVSHLLSDVANLADRIALIENSELQIGQKEAMLTEETLNRVYGAEFQIKNIEGEYFINLKKN